MDGKSTIEMEEIFIGAFYGAIIIFIIYLYLLFDSAVDRMLETNKNRRGVSSDFSSEFNNRYDSPSM
jgi:hypothetical protein